MLVLFPSSTTKLWAQWQGPYEIKRQIGKVDYKVEMFDKKKRKRVLHVNTLKEWVSPVGGKAEEFEEDDIVLLHEEEDQDNRGNLCTGKHLDGHHLRELQDPLNQYSDVMQNKPHLALR